MIVVADTSPLNYLLLIGEIELLPRIFGQVLAPESVVRELRHPRTAKLVQNWLHDPPSWFEVRALTFAPDPSLSRLDPGEREAIALTLQLGGGTVLIDDAEGRRVAMERKLEVRDTLGILDRASTLGFIDFRDVFTKLEQTNFRVSPEVKKAFLLKYPL